MTIEHHPRPFGARIVDGVKVAALLFVLSVIVAAADRTLVSPDAVDLRGAVAPSDAAPTIEQGGKDVSPAASHPSPPTPDRNGHAQLRGNGH
jgi:hypothetical protein